MYDIIESLPLTGQHKLIKGRYRFGDSIVTNGKFDILDDTLTPLIDYSPIPLFIPISKHLEVFVFNNERIIPLNLIQEGKLVGLLETVDTLFNRLSKPKWSVNAGARSLFMLPKITDRTRYQRMGMKYQIPSDCRVKNLQDHFHLFKYLAQHKNFPDSTWQSEVIIFTKEWFKEKNQYTKVWSRFYSYIYKEAWQIANFVLTKFNIELEWESFASAIANRHLKPSQYIANTIKHLTAIGFGYYPGFRIADKSEKSAPIKGLQRVFAEDYKLDGYLPLMMHIAPLNAVKTHPVYYSLSYPTLLEGSPTRSLNRNTLMLDIKEIMTNVSAIKSRTSPNNIIHQLNFDYFHVEHDKYQEVTPSSLMTSYDTTLLPDKKFNQARIFPTKSQFWKGCIAMTTV